MSLTIGFPIDVETIKASKEVVVVDGIEEYRVAWIIDCAWIQTNQSVFCNGSLQEYPSALNEGGLLQQMH